MKSEWPLFRLSFVLIQQPLLLALLVSGLLAPTARATSIKRPIRVETTPAEASVEVQIIPGDGDAQRTKTYTTHSFETEVIKFVTGDTVIVTASCPDYETVTNVLKFDDLHTKDAGPKNPFRLSLVLPQLRQQILVEFVGDSGTKFYLGGTPIPSSVSLTFVRDRSTTPWHSIVVRAERPHYKTVELTYQHDAVEALPLENGRRQLRIGLEEIERPVTLAITANEPGAIVRLDGKQVATTPGEVPITFRRSSADGPWSKHVLEVEKTGYEYRPAGLLLGEPVFQTNLTFELVKSLNQTLSLPDFQPVRFFQVPMYRFGMSQGEIKLVLTNSLSAKDANDALVTELRQFGGNPKGEPLIVGRIGAALTSNAQGKPGLVVLTLPVTNVRQSQGLEIIGSQIYLLNASGSSTPVTDGDPGVYDFDPCISKDGKTVYYSSDRGGQRGIWKKSVSGQGRSPVDPGRGVDVEPSVFTSSDGLSRVVFARYSLRAAVGTPPLVVVQEEDRLSFAETRRGRSPAWSNDGTKIAYVSPDNKICVMDANGENNRVLTSGKTVDDSPLWLPGDKQIVYSSATSPLEARNGTGNFDLWRVDQEGNTQQILSNLSFDGLPTVTSEALVADNKQGTLTYIYFISNRGAQHPDEDAWKIHYFELK
jgi:hypothetical protein